MWGYLFGYTVACLLALAERGRTLPSGEIGKAESQVISYEEYVVEHEISMEHARNAAKSIDLKSVKIPPGCQACTPAELNYCQGSDFINDHCCCDKRYHEVLPYIPHTCYIGTQLCRPIVNDCETYTRLRKCCCHPHEIRKWKNNAARVSARQITKIILPLLLIFQIMLFY